MLTTAGVTFSATSAIRFAFQGRSAASAGVENAKRQERATTDRIMPFPETNARCTLFSLRRLGSGGLGLDDLRHGHFRLRDGDRHILRDRVFPRLGLGFLLKS